MFCEPAKKKSRYKNKYLHRLTPKWDGFCMFSSRGMCMTQIPISRSRSKYLSARGSALGKVRPTDLAVEAGFKFKALAAGELVEDGLLLDGSGSAISGVVQVVLFDESVDGGGQEAWTRRGDCWWLRVAEQNRRTRRVFLVQAIDGRFVVVLADVVVGIVNAGSSRSTAAHFDLF